VTVAAAAVRVSGVTSYLRHLPPHALLFGTSWTSVLYRETLYAPGWRRVQLPAPSVLTPLELFLDIDVPGGALRYLTTADIPLTPCRDGLVKHAALVWL